jgi:aryl-alcohol dehydrogenase-like predicted oxidoreductase
LTDEVKRVAAELGETAARVAIAWVVGRPGVVSTLMGVSRAEQVTDNISALKLHLSDKHVAALDAVSADSGKFLYGLFQPQVRNQIVFGGADILA